MNYPDSFLNLVNSSEGVELRKGIDLSSFSTFKTKTIGDLLIVRNVDFIRKFLKENATFNIRYKMLGWGANQVLSTFSGFYLKLELPFDRKELEIFKSEFKLPASVSLAVLTSVASKLKIKGWEVLTGIPASLGGAIFMNAGTALGEIASITKSFEYVNLQGEIVEHQVGEKTFSYRKNNIVKPGEVIISATLKTTVQDEEIPKKIKDYLKYRNNSQPMNKNTCGCVFKNHVAKDGSRISAGQIIDLLGLKGFGIPGIRISPIHANFFEHDGTLTDGQVISFLELVKDIVQLYTGIELEFEVQI
ncbi:MAG: UDP-N-acetylmuramate dehydrogenase [Bdellovibrio sp.]